MKQITSSEFNDKIEHNQNFETLLKQPHGAFMIQRTSNKSFLLSVCASNESKSREIISFQIVKTSKGYKFKVGFPRLIEKSFQVNAAFN